MGQKDELKMTPAEYINLAMRTNSRATINPSTGELELNCTLVMDRILLLADIGLGLWEAGEAANHIRKHLGQGHPLSVTKINDELSDLFWYIAEWCAFSGTTFEELMEMNIRKLSERYPKGRFDVQDSINRKV